jgi:hypothetical protein
MLQNRAGVRRLGSEVRSTVCAVVAREPHAQNWRRGSNALMRAGQRGQATELIELLDTSLCLTTLLHANSR